MSEAQIIEMNAENIYDLGFCGTKNPKHEGCRRKAEWFKKRKKEGMRYLALHDEDKGTIGMIEYIPGEVAWRGVDAKGYMVIHCLCIFHKPAREKGVASRMIDACIEDAEKENKLGVAVVTRKGAWMVGQDIFLKKGFEVVDTAKPDFTLLVKKFKKEVPAPTFTGNWERTLEKYNKGLTILWSDQCPYVAKSIKEIKQTIKERYKIKANIIEMTDHEQAQNAPSPYSIFSLIHDGELLAFHPISSKRFTNILDKILGR
jgi:hypothetical protein